MSRPSNFVFPHCRPSREWMNEWMSLKKKEEENETKFGRFPFLFLFDFLFGQLFRNAKKRPKKSNKSWWDNEDGGYSIKREIRKKNEKFRFHFIFISPLLLRRRRVKGRDTKVSVVSLPSFYRVFFYFLFFGFFFDSRLGNDGRPSSAEPTREKLEARIPSFT